MYKAIGVRPVIGESLLRLGLKFKVVRADLDGTKHTIGYFASLDDARTVAKSLEAHTTFSAPGARKVRIPEMKRRFRQPVTIVADQIAVA